MPGPKDVVFGIYKDWGNRFKLWNKDETRWMSHYKDRIEKKEDLPGHAGVTKLTLDASGDYVEKLKFGP